LSSLLSIAKRMLATRENVPTLENQTIFSAPVLLRQLLHHYSS